MDDLTIGDVLAERRAAGRLLKLYRTARVSGPWVGEDEDRSLWQWPADDAGWLDRKPWTGDRSTLVEVPPHNAAGTEWPGLKAPQ